MRQLILTTLAGAICLGPVRAESQAAPDERPWTFMIYGAADNNADGPILEFLDGVRVALDDDPGMELIVFLDRSRGFSNDASVLGEDFTDARVYRLRSDSAEELDARDFFPDMVAGEEYEADSSDPETLGRFVAFCKARFPARRYGLMIYSHANGVLMCPDDESGGEMGIPALREVVGEEASVDLLALELCNMAGIEIAYEWRPGNGGFSADVLVAIPNAGIPLDWDRAFWRIRSEGHATSARGAALDPATMSASDFGRLVVEEGYAGRRAWVDAARDSGRYDLDDPAVLEMLLDKVREAAGCFDLARAADVKRAVDELASALAQAGGAQVVGELRGSEDDRLMHYASRGKFYERPYVDLFELLGALAECEALPDVVRGRASVARQAVDDMVVASFGLEEGFETFEPGRHGLFIVFPGDDSVRGPGRPWTGFSWYTPDATSHVAGGRWAFLADGVTPGNGEVEGWFELLASWSAEYGAPLDYRW